MSCRRELVSLFIAGCFALTVCAMSRKPAQAVEVETKASGEAAVGPASSAPFVAGFDRFARHGEIDEAAGGRLLVSELSCTACHASEAAELSPKRGPDLTGVGNRVKQDWLRHFLTSPAQTKPGTTMPDCFAGMPEDRKRDAIAALVAFLSTQQQAFPEIQATGLNPVPYRFWERGQVAQGKNLYHKIGCIACHAADPDYDVANVQTSQLDQMLANLSDEELEELGFASAARPVRSVPLPDLNAKHTGESLTHFLLAPEKTRPGGRMPDFDLSATDAADIAAYLLRRERPATPTVATEPSDAVTPADAAKTSEPTGSGETLRAEGQRLFTTLGCVHCHRAGTVPTPPRATPFARLNWSAERRCDVAASEEQPFFALDPLQSSAIRAAASDGVQWPQNAVDAAQHRLLQLNCVACHTRNELGGVGRERQAYFETVGSIDLGDEGRLPPPLSGVGRKLTNRWLQQVLRGEGAVRPHMQIRMPRFPAAIVASLPDLLTAADLSQRPSDTTSETETEDATLLADESVDSATLAEAGRRLLDTGCVQCHPVQGEALPGVVGVDLGNIHSRIRPGWFRDFILDPGSLKPRTRMPTFFPDGESQDTTLLNGDADLQIAALWSYLKRSKDLPLPEKIQEARSQDYELKPTTKPLLLRTFMQHAGTHAVAVGFPQAVHYAFDAEVNRLAMLWRGRFIDAQGTWFVRFAPPANPLEKPVLLPEGFPFALLGSSPGDRPWPLPSQSAATFAGYRLDSEGVPTLLYRWNGLQIEDRIIPEQPGLKRTLMLKGHLTDTEKRLWFRAHAGELQNAASQTARSDQQRLTVRLPDRLAENAIQRTVTDEAGQQTAEWLVPLDHSPFKTPGSEADGTLALEVHYEW